MDPRRTERAESTSDESRRTGKRVSRGFEGVSHLFLSPSPQKRPPEIVPVQTLAERDQSETPLLLHYAPTVDRELILRFLTGSMAALEEGLRTIDINIPCDPFGFIDLMAVDSRNQLCIINVDVVRKDESILRGIACADWIGRNTPIVRRMYPGHVINFSAQPRLFLVAPDFSPVLQCVAQRWTNPKVCCFVFRTVAMPGGVGILFDPA